MLQREVGGTPKALVMANAFGLAPDARTCLYSAKASFNCSHQYSQSFLDCACVLLCCGMTKTGVRAGQVDQEHSALYISPKLQYYI